MSNRFVFRILAAGVLLAIVFGAGSMIYNAGIARGLYAGAPVLAAPGLASPAQPAQPGTVPYPYYGAPFFRPWGGWGMGFSPFGCLVPLLFIFLFFALLRGLRHGWGRHMHGAPEGQPGGWVPPHFEEWHRRAHGEPSPGEASSGTQPPEQEPFSPDDDAPRQ